MKIKSFLIMVLSLISLTVAAQNGGIKGKVAFGVLRQVCIQPPEPPS